GFAGMGGSSAARGRRPARLFPAHAARPLQTVADHGILGRRRSGDRLRLFLLRLPCFAVAALLSLGHCVFLSLSCPPADARTAFTARGLSSGGRGCPGGVEFARAREQDAVQSLRPVLPAAKMPAGNGAAAYHAVEPDGQAVEAAQARRIDGEILLEAALARDL